MSYYSKNSERIKKYSDKVRQERKDSGLCQRCGTIKDDDVDKEFVNCQNCRERIWRER